MILVGRIDRFNTFSEWLMSESIKPLEVDFGSNPPLFNNKKMLNYLGGISGTCFVSDNLLYAVQFSENGEVAFGVCNKIPKDLKELGMLKFSDNRIVTKSALKVLNKVFYVLIELLKSIKKDVYFSAANEGLSNIYRAMLRNKFFNIELNKIGYCDIIFEDNVFKIKVKHD